LPAKKETSGETKTTKSQTRYSYGDIVKSNQEVRDAINALAEALAPAQAPAAAAPAPVTDDRIEKKIYMQTELIRKMASDSPSDITGILAEQNARIDALLTSKVPTDAAPSDTAPYLTSREQFDLYNKIISRHDAEFADKQFIGLMEQICSLREDFRRLCTGMEQNIAGMKAEDVLNSFKNYQTDIDNMLKDAGVRFGAFSTQGQKADPVFQRVVGVVPTEEADKDGTVAKRLSAGYEYKGRPVYKEKVMVYRSRSQ
jgi:molecular chaperone GrpE (heat shock protein)